jgi:RNA polymerase sigma-70 factor (ECF subfamily)
MAERSHRTEIEARFKAIIDEHGALLRNTIVRICPKDLGLQFDDIEQEARLKLWRGIEAEREIRDLPSYIYRMAVTTSIDAIRQAKSRREDQLRIAGVAYEQTSAQKDLATDHADSPDRVAAHRLLIEKVREILDSFPDHQRRAVGLHLQGMTTSEIGALLDWTEPKARNLLHRGLKELRKRLRNAGFEYEVR